MMNFIKIALLCIQLWPLMAFAQQYKKDETDDLNKPRKLGVRLGVGLFGIRSEALPANELIDTLPAIGFVNNRLEFGYTASAFFRAQISKSFHIQTEVGGTLKGSRFDNGDSGYSRITVLSIDVPFYGLIDLTKDEKLQILFGPQISFNINNQMYIGNEVVASFVKIPMRTLELFAVGGIQYNGSLVGLQLTFKYGLSDINDGWQTWQNTVRTGSGNTPDQIRPTIRNVGRISNFGIELGLCF